MAPLPAFILGIGVWVYYRGLKITSTIFEGFLFIIIVYWAPKTLFFLELFVSLKGSCVLDQVFQC